MADQIGQPVVGVPLGETTMGNYPDPPESAQDPLAASHTLLVAVAEDDGGD